MAAVEASEPQQARLALRALLTGHFDSWERFDDLFDAYWYRQERAERQTQQPQDRRYEPSLSGLWADHFDGGDAGEPEGGDGDEDTADGSGVDGRLIARLQEATAKRDLRELVDPATLRDAEAIAERLAKAIRDRRSRRRRRACRGAELDLRAVARASLARGGEPFDLRRKRRIVRPMRLVAILDVSGSMQVYARVFLAFLKGLLSADERADAYFLHTRLVRVGGALRDPDPMRSATRLSLMSQGFGGGTKLGACFGDFNDRYAKTAVDGRTMVVILSDGYDTGSPERVGVELQRLQKRARRIVWLNPLLGWRDYAPVAASMAAALPHIDLFRPANTLEALAELEAALTRI